MSESTIRRILIILVIFLNAHFIRGQDLSFDLNVNDMENHPMQAINKPPYLNTIIDPSFGTVIRRITDAGQGNIIVPLYSTIQAWNADETYMIVFDQSNDVHLLLDGMNYSLIRTLYDILPDDDEQIFWSHIDPDILFYIDDISDELIRYHLSTQVKDVIVNLATIAGTGDYVTAGNDVMMQSWNDDVWGFRTSENPLNVYSYTISSNSVVQFSLGGTIPSDNYYAPMPAPSGNIFIHYGNIYDENGYYLGELNLDNNVEHGCTGKLTNGHDAYFAVAFEQGEQGGCQGTVVAHDLTDTNACFPLIGYGNGYPYPLSGTHISATAHNNTEGGWIAASMVGFDQDGQSILDQEIVIIKADQNNIKVCRVAHHRSDEDEFDYYGEPHVSISPSGTRLLFASDWSGAEDGQSIDCYVVELPIFYQTSSIVEEYNHTNYKLYPNPLTEHSILMFDNSENKHFTFSLYNIRGQLIRTTKNINTDNIVIDKEKLSSGIYFFRLIQNDASHMINGKIMVIK